MQRKTVHKNEEAGTGRIVRAKSLLKVTEARKLKEKQLGCAVLFFHEIKKGCL